MSFRVHRVSDETGEERPRRWASWTVFLLKVAGPVVVWLRSVQKQHEEEHRRARRIAVLKRIVVVLISILCAFLLLAGVARALIGLRVLSLQTFFAITGSDLHADEEGATNLLLLGSGDESHDGKDLTDTMMVVSIDPKTKSAILLSLPRDLYVLDTENMGAARINSLYRDYKGYLKYTDKLDEARASEQAIMELGKEVGIHLGIDIHYIAKIDFIGFVQAIDELGGVDVDVPYDIVDVEYPGPNYSFETFELTRGMHHLDGETALKYVRSRHTSSDFGRSARQQQLLKALAEKVQKEGFLRNAGRITNLLGIIGDHTQTTMTTREILSLAGLAMKVDTGKIISLQLNDRNGFYDDLPEPGGLLYNPPREYFDGASVLLPLSIPENPVTWKQIQLFVDLLQEHREAYLARPRIRVLNAGAKPGLARKLANELTRFGFEIAEIANAENRDAPTTTVIAGKDIAPSFSELLGALVTTPEGFPANYIDIAVGKDYVYQPLQDLYKPRP